MAIITGSDYDHIDIQHTTGGDTNRHMLKDAQARSDVGELKSAFISQMEGLNAKNLPVAWSPSISVGYYIAFSDGVSKSSSKYARINTLLPGYKTKIAIMLADPNYECAVSYYDATGAADGTGYVGHDNYSSGIHYIPAQAIKFCVSFRRVDGATFTAEDRTAVRTALTAYAPTDIALATQGMAADAKITGDAIKRVNEQVLPQITCNNLLVNAIIHVNQRYTNVADDNSSYSYFEVNVTQGKQYILSNKARWISRDGEIIVNNVDEVGYAYTATATETIYITIANSRVNDFAVVEVPNNIFSGGTFANPVYAHEQQMMSEVLNKSNLFADALLVEESYYSNGWYTSSTYDTYVVTVENGKTYTLGCRARFIYKQSEAVRTSTAQAGYTYTADFSGVLYITVYHADTFRSFVEYPADYRACGNYNERALSAELLAQESGTSKSRAISQNAINAIVNSASKGWFADSGSLADGEKIELPITNVKKNNVYSFFGEITAFSEIQMGHGLTNAYDNGYIRITSDKLYVRRYTTAESVDEYFHGLTIGNYIQVLISVGTNGKSASISICSGGNVFVQDNATWIGDGNGYYFVKSVGSTLTNCKFSWASSDIRLPLWGFGDSYFSISSSRWCGYLETYGFLDNVLLSAYPGESTTHALESLENLISIGKPKIALWALGMNDGSDSDNVPASAWMTGVTTFLNTCNENNIIPVLATIPTVPTVNHEAKNNYVRNSGYRYIDFAKAVGSQSDGTWYAGMLNTDGVHPTALGAKALFFRAICDLPELSFKH